MEIETTADGTEYISLYTSYEVDKIIDFLEKYRGMTFNFGSPDMPALLIFEQHLQLEEFDNLDVEYDDEF